MKRDCSLNGRRKEDWLTVRACPLGNVGDFPTLDTLSAVKLPPRTKASSLTCGFCAFLLCLLIVRSSACQANNIGLSIDNLGSSNLSRAIEQIESSNNPNALGDRDGLGQAHSIGRFQVGKALLSDFNRLNHKSYFHVEMRSPDQSWEVLAWAFNWYYPRLLKRLHKSVTKTNLLICWNAGCGKVGRPPLSTRKYLKRYQRAGGRL